MRSGRIEKFFKEQQFEVTGRCEIKGENTCIPLFRLGRTFVFEKGSSFRLVTPTGDVLVERDTQGAFIEAMRNYFFIGK